MLTNLSHTICFPKLTYYYALIIIVTVYYNKNGTIVTYHIQRLNPLSIILIAYFNFNLGRYLPNKYLVYSNECNCIRYKLKRSSIGMKLITRINTFVLRIGLTRINNIFIMILNR